MSNPENGRSAALPAGGDPDKWRQPGSDRMEDSKGKVVNGEEQNRQVNSTDQEWQNTNKETQENNSSSGNDRIDSDSESDTLHIIEGDDDIDKEKSIPNM